MLSRIGAILPIFLLSVFADVLQAASPVLSGIDPPGGQRGTVVDVVLNGQRLSDARGILFYTPGIEVTGIAPDGNGKVKAKLAISQNAALGEHPLRLWTATGISELRTFYVGPFPTVKALAPKKEPQAIPLNVTVSGVIRNEEVDTFSVEMKKGRRLTAEVEGIRLGNTLFDSRLAILTKDGRELAACDGCTLLVQDSLVSVIAPEDGSYLIQLRDSTYGGSDNCKYRLHVGTFPQPTVAYPPGGQAGAELAVHFLGDVSGPIEDKVKLPTLENGLGKVEKLLAGQDGQTAPAPNPIRVSPFPNVLAVESDHDAAHATKTDLPLPLAFNGIISKNGETDYFKFKAKKDETFDFRVYARALRSPLDSVLAIRDAQGKQLASNDDSGGPDSYLRFKIPADGEYCISVTDQLKRGGGDFTYRVEVTPVEPEVVLTMTQPVKDSQERQTVVVPRGNQYGAVLRVKRSDFDGDLVYAAANLPQGVAMQIAPMQKNADTVPIVFEAAADAPITAQMCGISARPADPVRKLADRFEHVVDLVLGDPNNTPYYQTRVNQISVAVAEEAPFKIHILEPKAPLVQNGSMNLRVVAERAGNFHGPISVSLLYKPSGIGADDSIKIPEGKDDCVIPLSANGDAPLRKWKVSVNGSADGGKGAVWVCSPFVDLEVGSPFVTGKIERSDVEQGASATVSCKLTPLKPFDGKAKIQLVNLPNKVSAQEMEITSSDQVVEFPVTADKTSPVGQKKDLYCILTIMEEGEPVVQNIAQGGVLRIGKTIVAK